MLEPDSGARGRKHLAKTLRELRKAAGLSGERLGVRAAMSQSKVSRIESGKIVPTVVDVGRIVKALEVPRRLRGSCFPLLAQRTLLRRRRWTLIRWGPEDAPDLVAAIFRWVTCADVLILRNEDHATGYRVPTTDDAEVFNPQVVSYQYHNNPLWTLRAMLSLPVPSDMPYALETPKRPECFLSGNLAVPVVIRPLSLSPRGT